MNGRRLGMGLASGVISMSAASGAYCLYEVTQTQIAAMPNCSEASGHCARLSPANIEDCKELLWELILVGMGGLATSSLLIRSGWNDGEISMDTFKEPTISEVEEEWTKLVVSYHQEDRGTAPYAWPEAEELNS